MKERVYRFRGVERALVASRPGGRALDLGCGRGENLARLLRYGARPVGIEPNQARARIAAGRAPVATARGEALPCAAGSFDLVYVSHALHHADDLGAALREVFRVLAPGGLFFVVETVDDSPLMRLARRIQPRWEGDEVRSRFRFADLVQALRAHGFEPLGGETFNWSFFGWELVPLVLPPLEAVTPLFIGLELAFRRLLDRFGGHCWIVAQKPGPSLFPARVLEHVRSRARLAPALLAGAEIRPQARG